MSPARSKQITESLVASPKAFEQLSELFRGRYSPGKQHMFRYLQPVPHPDLPGQFIARQEFYEPTHLYQLGFTREQIKMIGMPIVRGAYYSETSVGEGILRGIQRGLLSESMFERIMIDIGRPQYGKEIVPYIKLPIVVTTVAFGIGYIAAPTIAGVAKGAMWLGEKAATAIPSAMAKHAPEAARIMWEVQVGAMKIAAPSIAKDIGIMATVGYETYKAKTMYEAGVPIQDIAFSIGLDAAMMAAFALGARAAMQPESAINKALFGKPRLVVGGEIEKQTLDYYGIGQRTQFQITAGEAYYEPRGGLFSPLSRRMSEIFGRGKTFPLQSALLLPEDAIEAARESSLLISKEWTIIDSFQKDILGMGERVIPLFKEPVTTTIPGHESTDLLGAKITVPAREIITAPASSDYYLVKWLEQTQLKLAGMDIIKTPAPGISQLDINVWLGKQKTLVDLKPFEESIFEPWAKYVTSVVPTEKYTIIPRTLIKSPEYWASLQIDISRFIYPSGVIYPKGARVVVSKPAPPPQVIPARVSGGITIPEHTISWGTAESVEKEVGRVMEQASSLSLTGVRPARGVSYSKVYVELLEPSKTLKDFSGASGLVFTPEGVKFAQPATYQKISDSIFVAGGGGFGGQLNWAQQQQINRYLRLLELPPEEFSPFLQTPFPSIEPVPRTMPNIGAISGVIPAIRSMQSQSAAASQILSKAPTQIPHLAPLTAFHLAPLTAQAPAVSQIPSIDAIVGTIQSQSTITSQITLQTPAQVQIPLPLPPPPPLPPPFLESELGRKTFAISKHLTRDLERFERRWPLGRIEKMLKGKVEFREPRIRMPSMDKKIKFREPKPLDIDKIFKKSFGRRRRR